jgi:hypothetical protein
VPRHPPNALKALDRSHYQCPPVPGVPMEEKSSWRRSQREERTASRRIAEQTIRPDPSRLSLRRNGSRKTSVTRELPVGGAVRHRQLSLVLHQDVRTTLLFTMSANRRHSPSGERRKPYVRQAAAALGRAIRSQSMVEPDGIEPTTSCLQSRRSPN